jgi:hypothetical protein
MRRPALYEDPATIERVVWQFRNLPWHLPAVRVVMQMTSEDFFWLEEAEEHGLDSYLAAVGELCIRIRQRGVRY